MSAADDLLADAARLRRVADSMGPEWHQATANALRKLAEEAEAQARKAASK